MKNVETYRAKTRNKKSYRKNRMTNFNETHNRIVIGELEQRNRQRECSKD